LKKRLVKSAFQNSLVKVQQPAGCREVFVRLMLGHRAVPIETLVGRDLDLAHLAQ
jgi:hypothetical protein